MNRSLKDIYWLAGLLEGEGCFSINKRSDGVLNYSIRITSTDYDVIARANRVLSNKNTVRNYNEAKHYRRGLKPAYSAGIAGRASIGWMMTLYPLMGERRRTKIKEIINEWKIYSTKYQEGFDDGNSKAYAQA